MERISAAVVVCDCGATNPARRARCSSCGRPLAGDAAAAVGIDAALAQQRQRVQRLLAQAEHVAESVGAQLRRRRTESAREREEIARDARERIASDGAFRFARECEQLDTLLAPWAAGTSAAGWDDRVWSRLAQPGRPPLLLRIGEANLPAPAGLSEAARLPILVPGPGGGHLVARAGEGHRDEALGLIETVVLRAIASLPPGHVRFRVHDPVGMGASLDGFAAFEAGRTARGRPTTDGGQLRGVVEGLIEHANRVSGDYLRGRHRSLADFLDVAGHGEVPYELLVLLDHPHAVDPDLREQLVRLAANAASRGVMIIVHDREGTAVALPEATVVQSDGRGLWRSSMLPGVGFRLDPRPPVALVAAVAARRPPPPIPLPFEDLFAGESRWTRDSGEGLLAALGRSGVDPVELPFDDDTPHGLVAGDTGSGKSNLLRVVIYGLARRYAPRQLQLYLLDFKEGVEFREFAPSTRDLTFLPHARVVSTNSSREFGVQVLEHLARITQERYATMPEDAKKLSALRLRGSEHELPRIVLVIDEFHVLFERGDRLAERAATALTLIAKQGRAAGVHFLLATQAIGDVGSGNANAARLDGIVGAARLRVALRLDERESQAILRLGNRAAADLHERGVAIVNVRKGDEQGNRRTKVAMLEDAIALRERREAVSGVVGARRPARVFDGASGADACRSTELQRALKGRAPRMRRTWIGADLAVDDDDPRGLRSVAVDLTPDADRQLAVVGGGAARACGVLQWAAIGLGASVPRTTFTLVDLLRESDALPRAVVAGTAVALQALGCNAEVIDDPRASSFAGMLQERFEGAAGEAHAFVVFGADRLVGVGKPLDAADADAFMRATPRTAVEGLLPRLGAASVHLLAWWSTFDALEALVGSQLHQLGVRVYLDLPDQRVSIATGGQRDEAVGAPLALLHDVASGSAPRAFQPFDPFGADAPPEFLGARG
jgi:hypothetical protein